MVEPSLRDRPDSQSIASGVLVTSEMRVAGALAIENLEGVGSLEDKAAAAYRAMCASKKPNQDDDESWERFERAVDAAVKSGPKHRTSAEKEATKKKPKASKNKE